MLYEVITDLVMAVAGVSSAHKYAVSPSQVRFDKEYRIDPAGAHYLYRQNRCRIGHPVDTRQIRSGI